MAEDKNKSTNDSDALLSTIIADSPELWQLADQFVQGLPAHLSLMQDALRRSAVDQIKRNSLQLQAVSGASRACVLHGAEVAGMAEQAVIGGLSERIDDLTATILKIQGQLQNHTK